MTEERARALIRKANPVPDLRQLDSVATSALLDDWRKQMQTDDRPVVEVREGKRWRGPLIGIAAAAVILLSGLVYLLTKDDAPVAVPAPNATPLVGENVHPIAPGAYFADTDGDLGTTTRGTFVIESNWAGFDGGVLEDNDGGDIAVSMLVLEVERVSEALCGGGASAPAGTTAKALADQFAAIPGFITREALTPVSAFGRDGYHLVLEVPGSCTSGELFGWSSPVFFATDRTYGEGDIVEYWFLDVEGTPVMVEATRWSSLPNEEEVAKLSAVLDTLVITP